MPTIPPDAIINGVHNGAGAQLTLESMLWCLRGEASGWITGQLTMADGLRQRHFSFVSHSATMVHTMDDWISRGIAAAFSEVSVMEETYTPIPNCRLFLTGVSNDNGVWTGSVTIVYPEKEQPIFVAGLFAGNLQVFSQVHCTAGVAST